MKENHTKPTKARGLKRQERLGGRAALLKVYRDADRFACRGFRLFCMNNGLNRNRVAITTSRGFKDAVKRNREKRIGREIYRVQKKELSTGFDIILILQPGNFSFHDRKRQLLFLFKRSGLMR